MGLISRVSSRTYRTLTFFRLKNLSRLRYPPVKTSLFLTKRFQSDTESPPADRISVTSMPKNQSIMSFFKPKPDKSSSNVPASPKSKQSPTKPQSLPTTPKITNKLEKARLHDNEENISPESLKNTKPSKNSPKSEKSLKLEKSPVPIPPTPAETPSKKDTKKNKIEFSDSEEESPKSPVSRKRAISSSSESEEEA